MASTRPRYNKQGDIISYEIRVSRGRDENGRQLKPYTTTWIPDAGMSQKRIKSELARAEILFEDDCQQGKILTREEQLVQQAKEKQHQQQRPTLRQYAEDIFMPRKSAVFSENSIESYEGCFRRIFKYLGDMRMEDIRPGDISSCISALQTKERVTYRYRNGQEKVTSKLLSHNTVIKHYTVLHSLFTEAYQLDEITERNPIDKVRRPVPRKDEELKEMHAYSVEEARYILECLENEPLQWQVVIRLMLDTGARRGEITGLRWKSVNFEDCTIKIENNLQYSKKRGIYDTTPKGKCSRMIDIDPELIPLMRRLRNSQKVRSIKDYCFIRGDAQPLFPQTPTKYLQDFGKRYGIHELHPHALRHTAATIAITHGADIASVSAKLGHADKSTTLDMYTHADELAIKRGNEIYRNALYKQKAE
ncbi:MAG: tyrosine-type recombinase/integrase [Oscillospiraceae bacterium]